MEDRLLIPFSPITPQQMADLFICLLAAEVRFIIASPLKMVGEHMNAD